jgi:hypothetical protein
MEGAVRMYFQKVAPHAHARGAWRMFFVKALPHARTRAHAWDGLWRNI